MNMLEHTRVFTLVDCTRDEIDERSDALMDALVEMEGGHPELLDSAVVVDLAEGTVEATITVGHDQDYPSAVKMADALLVEAIETIGDYLRGADSLPPTHGKQLRNIEGPRSLAVA